MTVTKIAFRPGVTRELTTYANEGGFYSCDKVRFRTGYPEKIGGWVNYSPGNTFKGIARTMCNWVTYSNENLLGFGTNQLYYIENGGMYFDITPVASTTTLTNPFRTTALSNEVVVTSPLFDVNVGSFVTFSGGTAVGGITITGEYEIIQVYDSNTYLILASSNASSSTSGGGTVTAMYKISAGNTIYTTAPGGWGSMPWGEGGWGGSGTSATIPLQLWSQTHWNQDLVMALRAGPIYYWTKDTTNYTPATTINAYAASQVKYSTTLTTAFGTGVSNISVPNALEIDIGAVVIGTGIAPGTYVSTAYQGGLVVALSQATIGSSDNNPYTFSYSGNTAPNETFQIVSDITYQFLIAMGSTPYNPQNFNPAFIPTLVRWTDQSNAAEWTPTSYNQAGSQQLANGSYIVGSVSTRQEVLIWTDTSLYSMQYIGAPFVYGFTSLMDNISCISPNCMVTISGITYWMGVDKFYVYSGVVSTLPCSLRKYIFDNINITQSFQIVSGFNERFNEVWWFYPSVNSNTNDSYVIFNYLENTWYYGTLNRSAWLDSPLRSYPMAAFSIQQSYLATPMGTTDTSLALINGTSYPATGVVLIDSELIQYTNITGNTLNGLTRGYMSTTPTLHSPYVPVALQIPNQILFHEDGYDDGSWVTNIGLMPINSYLNSSDFDIGDGDHYAFCWRILPDFAFNGSTATSPQIMLTIYPRQNAGAAYQTDVDQPVVTSSTTYPVEEFTGIVYTRVRGRAMAFQVSSPNLGVFWQMGAIRFDFRPDGRR